MTNLADYSNQTATAVEPLDRAFNVAVNKIANIICPLGWKVSDDAPHTLDDATQYFLEHGHLCVWKGGSDRTIFACPETNYAFRAWHDAKHIQNGLEFDLEGETAVYHMQCADIWAMGFGPKAARRFCRILEAEIIGQFLYNAKHGEFPINQMEFVALHILDPKLAINHKQGSPTITPVDIDKVRAYLYKHV